MEAHEQDLVARWGGIAKAEQQERQLLLRESVSFLQKLDSSDHWWCQHSELTQCFSCVFKRHDQPGQHVLQKLWTHMSQQLSSCAACIVALHTALVNPGPLVCTWVP